jgi:DNA repair protein RadD
MNLRPYQTRAIADLRASYAAGNRAPCLVLPTGAGKTVVASSIIRSATERSKRVLFLAHRAELIDQSMAKLEATGVTDVRMIRAEHDLGSPNAPVTVASVQTLTKWIDRMPKADLVVFDECHHVVAKTWARIADTYAASHLLGMTATPQRGDGKSLGDIFDDLVVGSTVKELTALGHLVPCRVWSPTITLDTAQLALSASEAYAQHGNGQRAVLFCSTVEHAEIVAAEMGGAGITCEVVHGSSSGRAAVLKRFRDGETRAIANVHVLTEGWDDPGVAVCILVRKPQHAGTFLQMVGRVLRPSPGKQQATLIDLCGSVLEHGTPEADREFTLDGKGIKSAEREPIRQCPTCGGVFLSPAGTTHCPQCGAALPVRAVQLPTSVGVGLAEVAPGAPAREYTIALEAKYPGRCSTCQGRIAIGERIFWSKNTKPRHERCPRMEIAA